MDKLELIKKEFCEMIMELPEDELLDWFSSLGEAGVTLPDSHLTCDKCRKLYGECESEWGDTFDTDVCKKRFHLYLLE